MPFKNKEDKRKYDRAWVANRRKNFFKDKKCIKCGSTEKLELDHIKREDKKSHKIWSWSDIKREEEIKKCQILCHDCHLEKTIKESTNDYCPRGHGLKTKTKNSKFCRMCCKLRMRDKRK